MSSITSYDRLEDLGRVRLSRNFFMREFLYSEIAAWHGLRNVPDNPERAIEAGRMLCQQLLEPLQATFGRIHVRSGYRSPEVNKFGNENKLNCASNEKNFGRHIWDYLDERGRYGAMACIVIPWLVDYIEKGGSWTAMAWWIHDHLPYSSLYFFPRQGAFNIGWHELPERRIDSYSAPKGCLTRQGMENHQGSHRGEYPEFPQLVSISSEKHVPPANLVADPRPGVESRSSPTKHSVSTQKTLSFSPQTGGAINYRAIHTRNLWRKVGNHTSLEKAILGKDGAVGLFARKVRIDYAKHGDPLYVLVWEGGADKGFVIRPDSNSPEGIRVASVPMHDIQDFESRGQASQRALDKYFGA